MKCFLSVLFVILSLPVQAKIVSETVQYKEKETLLEGHFVYDTKFLKKQKKLPAVIVVHDWMGVGDYVKMRAEQLASLGYLAFVADIYGLESRPKDTKEASALVGKYKSGDRALMRARALAAFEQVKNHKLAASEKIATMGYCFGGTVSLEMARLGLPLTGAVSFHGGLNAVDKKDAANIKTKLLILHGAIDPYVPQTEVDQFLKEVNENKIDYQFISYSNAVHAFTEKHVGNDPSKGAAYNEAADKRSFVAMKNFLEEINIK